MKVGLFNVIVSVAAVVFFTASHLPKEEAKQRPLDVWAFRSGSAHFSDSLQSVEDAARRIEQGYSAIAVKVIAKTLSITMKIVQYAYEKKVPCFCADLTVNPILVDWNKSVAARLAYEV